MKKFKKVQIALNAFPESYYVDYHLIMYVHLGTLFYWNKSVVSLYLCNDIPSRPYTKNTPQEIFTMI